MGRRNRKCLDINPNDYSLFETENLNDLTELDYYERMKRIILSMFEWSDLPTSMNRRFLERTLFEQGQCAILKDNGLIINTRCANKGKITIYEEPTELSCYSIDFQTNRWVFNGLNDEKVGLTSDNQAVLLYNTEVGVVPSDLMIRLFSHRLAHAQRTIDCNIENQKFPILILGNDKQQKTLQALYEKYSGNQPVIYGDSDSLQADMMKSIDTKAPYVADKVSEYKKEIWNEFLTTFGINNIDVEKKERLISGESNSNNEAINFNLQSFLAPRQEACKKINELFGLNVSVKVRSDLYNIIKQEESIITDYNNNGIDDELEGGEENVE